MCSTACTALSCNSGENIPPPSSLDQYAQLCPCGFPMRPIHGTIGLQPYQTFVGLFFLRPSFPITYTEIFRQSIIRHALVFLQPRHLSPLFGLSDIGCNFNELLYESSGRQRLGMVPRRQALRSVGKSPLPDNVVSASGYGCRYPESFITIPDPNYSGAVEGPPPQILRNERK